MKVKELIEILQTMNQDAMVVTRGYEGGVDECIQVYPCIIALNVNTEWYYGEHEIVDDDGFNKTYPGHKQVPGVKL